MPRAEKEFVLNYAMNRWQLNFKRNVGPTSQSIRECAPHGLEEWRTYYYANVRSREHIDGLGRKLFERISQVLPDEVRFHPELLAGITEEDCLAYMHGIVIERTYYGYKKERGG